MFTNSVDFVVLNFLHHTSRPRSRELERLGVGLVSDKMPNVSVSSRSRPERSRAHPCKSYMTEQTVRKYLAGGRGQTFAYQDMQTRKINPSPGNGFLRRLPATGRGEGVMAPRHISSSRAHSNKTPTATPMFSESVYLTVVLPVSWEFDVCSKSKMAAKLPEVPITMLVLQIHVSFQKQYRSL